MARSKKPAQQQSETEGSTITRIPTRRTPSPPESERPVGPLSVVTSQDRDVIKVNTASATELKNACDDAVKRVRVLLLSLYVSKLKFFC
jgi:signal peptidase complex subunit 2